jgi:ribosomal protein S1
VCFIKEPEKYVDKSYEFIITEFDRKKNAAKASALENIAEEQIFNGTMSKIINFGAFIKSRRN